MSYALPPGSAAMLWRALGRETFSEHPGCLHCVEPGTGSTDMPWALSSKSASVTRAKECGANLATWDPELQVQRACSATSDSELAATLSKRAGDAKIGGPQYVDQFISHEE